MYENREKLQVPLMAVPGRFLSMCTPSGAAGAGAVAEVESGVAVPADKQPSRIGRMMRLPAFLLAVCWQRIRRK